MEDAGTMARILRAKMQGRTKLLVLAIALAIILLPLAPILLSPDSARLKVLGQGTPDWSWWTLAGSIYRNASVPPPLINGYIIGGQPTLIYKPNDYYSIDSNILVVDLNNDGLSEIIAVDASGRLVILGASGLLNNPDQSYYALSPYSTPAAADVDGDGLVEVIIGTKDGKITAIEVDPSTWSTRQEWISSRVDSMITTSPLLIDARNGYEVIVSGNSGVYCLNASTGSVIWSRIFWERVFLNSPAAIGDVNGDGVDDVVHVSSTGKVYVISGADGSILWYLNLYNDPDLRYLLVIHSPIVADTDGSGLPEIVINMGREVFGYDASLGGYFRTGVEGYIVIVSINPSSGLSYVKLPGPQDQVGATVFAWFSQPAIAAADTDGDGAAEVYIGSVDGYIYVADYTPGQGYSLYRLPTQQIVDPWATVTGASSNAISLALADVDSDGQYEVVAYSTYDGGVSPPKPYYRLLVLETDGSKSGEIVIGYDRAPLNLNVKNAKLSWPTLALGDINGDSLLDVVINAYQCILAITS